MHRKQLSLGALAALVALLALLATLSSRLGTAPEHSLPTPVASGRTGESLAELAGGAGRDTVLDERVAESALDASAGQPFLDAADGPGDELRSGLTGRVVDASGAPVAGAEVWVHTGRHTTTLLPWFWAHRARLATHSAADGSFVVEALRTDKLEARASGHAPSRIEHVSAAGASIVLSLRGPAARLTGAVFAGGSAVPRARLDLRRPRHQVSDDERANRRFPAGEDGSFVLDDLAPGLATLIASAPGFAPLGTPLELRAGETTEVRIQLDPGATLTGVVVGPDHAPIAGVQVVAPEREPPPIALTDERGAFAWTGLAPGSLRIVARRAGFEDAEHASTLGVGENAGCTIVLVPLALLEGRVVDALGAPAAGVTVESHVFGSDSNQPTARDVSDADGSFQIHVPNGSEHTFVLREPNQWLGIDASWLGSFVAPSANIVLRLRPEDHASAFVSGRVVDEGGPLTGAWLQIGDGTWIGTVGANTPGTPVSDAAGRFRIGPLPAREFVLVVHPADSRLPTFRSAPFSLAPGEERDLGDVALPPRVTLVGRASFEDGEPAAGALLQVETTDGEYQVFTFGDDGTLEHGLLPGSYQALVYGGEFLKAQQEFDLAVGEVEFLEFILRRAIRCPLDVTLPEGETSGRLLLRAADGSQEFEYELDDSFLVVWPGLTTVGHLAELTCVGGHSFTARLYAVPPDGCDKSVV
ncbi:MAG: carboxypeptidase regulatory-like domain-containing protein, partial [Planctomycetota bacterium]